MRRCHHELDWNSMFNIEASTKTTHLLISVWNRRIEKLQRKYVSQRLNEAYPNWRACNLLTSTIFGKKNEKKFRLVMLSWACMNLSTFNGRPVIIWMRNIKKFFLEHCKSKHCEAWQQICHVLEQFIDWIDKFLRTLYYNFFYVNGLMFLKN